MPTPTTMRAELLKSIETFNDRFFLTMGNTGAGMTPYNPIQPGLGARLILQTDRNVRDVTMTLHRVGDAGSVPVGSLNPVRTSDSTWEVEGAIGGARLGFPQPAPSYHVPQCFELTVVARNRRKVDRKTYTFWVGEGVVGTIASCIDRQVIGTKPLIAGYDSLGWHDYAFPDNYAEFYARNSDPAFTADDDDLYGLLPDPMLGVYVPGAPNILPDHFGQPSPDDPFTPLPEPSAALPADPMDALRDGYGDQWKYRRVPTSEIWQHGTIQKAQRLSPAAVHPTLGTGLVDNLVANPQVADDIGGGPGSVNLGYPRGVDGVRIEYVSGENWGPTGSDDFVFDLVMDEWAPGVPGTLGYHILFGEAADWVGGGNLGGYVELQSTQPAHLLCSIKPAAAYYDALDGGVAWPAANTIGATIGVAAPGTVRITLRRSTSGVPITNGVVYAVQVIAHTPGSITIAGAGYFGRQFPLDTIRSNVLRLLAVV